MDGFKVPNANQGGGGPKDCVTVPRELAPALVLSPDYDHAFFAIMSSSRFHGKTRFFNMFTARSRQRRRVGSEKLLQSVQLCLKKTAKKPFQIYKSRQKKVPKRILSLYCQIK